MTVDEEEDVVLHVTTGDIASNVTPGIALPAARRAAALQQSPDTTLNRLTLPFSGGWMRVLAASTPSLGVFGYKEFHLSPVGSVRYAIHVFDISDGRPIGIVDGAMLTPLRTAAAAAATAVAYFDGHPPALDVGIVGSSTEAAAGLRALVDALPVKSVTVTSRSDDNRRHFATAMSEELQVDVSPCPDIRSAAMHRDVVYVATASGGRVVITDEDLGDLPLLLSIGSTLPPQRELHADVLVRANSIIIDTPDVLEESGDAIAARDALTRSNITQLGEFLKAPRRPPGRTVYTSIGSPEQDIALAVAVLRSAAKYGFGKRIDPLSTVKWNS